MPAPFVYLEDPASFANLVTIQGAHTLDLLLALGGSIEEVTSLLSRQFPDILLGDGKTSHRRETYNHLIVQGRLAAGVSFTAEVAGGRKGNTPFWLEVRGEKSSLKLQGGAPRGLQAGRIDLAIDGSPISLEQDKAVTLPDAAANVCGVYTALRDDIRDDSRRVANFNHAFKLSCLIEQVLNSPADQTGGLASNRL